MPFPPVRPATDYKSLSRITNAIDVGLIIR